MSAQNELTKDDLREFMRLIKSLWTTLDPLVESLNTAQKSLGSLVTEIELHLSDLPDE